ncbi:unnamed protein product [Closterium sp. Naga37s-1]|nr:unnamed protein product [Closterium sp. Naga37s-1]
MALVNDSHISKSTQQLPSDGDIESGNSAFLAPDASLSVSSSPSQKSLPLFCCAPPLARNAVSASDSVDEENPGEFTAVYPPDLHIANPKEVTTTADEIEKLRKDEKHRQKRLRRTCCCRVACWSLIVLTVVIVGLGVAGLVAYLTVSKQQPEVKVEQINIIRVGITKSGGGFLGLENFRLGLSALINVTALVYNPNNWDVEAEDISIDVKFFDMHVANVTLPGVVGMSKGGSAQLTVPLDIVDAPLATLSPASLLTTPLLHGRAEMRVVVGTAARVKYWGISSPRVMVHVECTMQLDPFSAKKYNEQWRRGGSRGGRETAYWAGRRGGNRGKLTVELAAVGGAVRMSQADVVDATSALGTGLRLVDEEVRLLQQETEEARLQEEREEE